MSDIVRLGVIGIGNMGKYHLSYLNSGDMKNCEVTAVCDIDERQIKDLDPKYKKFTDSKELIRSGKVDAVIISTPHYDHTTIGIDAFENNLHVLVEKPISVHKADCERLIAAAKAHPDKKFTAMFQMRTEPVYKKIKQLITTGEIGEIRRINWIATFWFRSEAYYKSGGWRATWSGEGGGVLLNQSPHNLDMWQWLFGMPAKVRSFLGIGKYHDIEVEDDVTTYMEYANGATALFTTTTGEYPGTNRLEITGERGLLLLEDGKLTMKRNEVETTEFSKTTPNGFSTPEFWNVEIPIRGKGGAHKEITQNFINAILYGEELLAPAEEGINSVELANAMIYSHFTDSTVEMPLDGAAYEAKLKELIASSTYVKEVVESKEVDMNASFK